MKRVIKYAWMWSVGLEMNLILRLMRRFPILEKVKFPLKRVDKLADAFDILLVDLGFRKSA